MIVETIWEDCDHCGGRGWVLVHGLEEDCLFCEDGMVQVDYRDEDQDEEGGRAS